MGFVRSADQSILNSDCERFTPSLDQCSWLIFYYKMFKLSSVFYVVGALVSLAAADESNSNKVTEYDEETK